MLANELYSIYQQYKADTNYIASWLAETAKSYGCDSELLKPPSESASRVKGKAQQRAKKNTLKNETTYTIAISNFVPLATFIAEHQPVISVPESLAAALRRVIKARGGFSGLLQDHGYDLDEAANSSHEHFVGVLANVCKILGPRMLFSTRSTNQESESSHNSDTDFVNYFSRLSMDELPEPSSNAPHTPISKSKQKVQVQYVAEPQVSREDAAFFLYQALEDIDRIRSYIVQTWNHVLGDRSQLTCYPLASAAILTSLGIELVQELIEDVTEACQKHGGVQELLDILCRATAIASGLPEEQMWESGPENTDQVISDDMYRFHEDFFLTPLYLLSEYRESKTLSHNNLDIKGLFPLDEDPHGRDKQVTDVAILHWYFVESHLLATTWGDIAEDVIMKDMRDPTKFPINLIHLAFGGQIFLDLHHAHGEKLLKPFEVMIRQLLYHQEELRAYALFLDHHPTGSSGLDKNRRKTLNDISESLESIISDKKFEARVNTCNVLDIPAPSQRHEFLKRNPVLCGLVLSSFQGRIQKYGIDMLNSDPAFIGASHLYNALMKEELLDKVWLDIAVVMNLFPQASLFVGDEKPRGLENCYRRFLIQLGVLASKFASNRQRPRGIKSHIQQRQLPKNAELLSTFIEKYKYKGEGGSSSWTKMYLETILNKANYEELVDEHIEPLRGQLSIRVKNRDLKSSKKGSASHGTRLSVDELFCSLRKYLLADTLCLSFPYLTMHRMAWECLSQVKMACEPLMGNCDYDRNRIDHLVSMLFIVSTSKISPRANSNNILVTAAKTMNDFSSSMSSQEAHRRLHNTMGIFFSKVDTHTLCKYSVPPMPAEEDIIKWRIQTHTEDLFAERKQWK
ncbi:hypothetical protein F4805DRAFT_458574 [Annulohypoxylon moriforme]|nr:hypothetical protein F4805DRAFT_458574 [Annulohypoxylon moriforme]